MYTFYITKKQNWFDKGNDITIKEWKMVLAQNRDFKAVDSIGGILDKEKMYFSLKNCQIGKWRDSYFVLTPRGNIEFQQEELMNKAKEIAKMLGAKVQGDELETY